MNTFSDNLLDVVGRLSERLGPVTAMIDGIVDRIAPKATGRASCPGGWHYYKCGPCCTRCSGDYLSWVTYFYSNGSCTECGIYC